MPGVPLPVAEQIGIVFVFCVVMLAVIKAISALLNDQRKEQLASQKELLKHQQDYISEQNQLWQQFLVDQRQNDSDERKEDRAQISRIAEAMANLVDSIGRLHEEITSNARDVEARFDAMMSEDEKAILQHDREDMNRENHRTRKQNRSKNA